MGYIKKLPISRKEILLMVKWCEEIIGPSPFTNEPIKFSICKTKKPMFMKLSLRAEYDDKNTKMILYLQNIKTLRQLCDTIIHEYTHYCQDMKMYEKYCLKYYRNYHNHPYEISAKNKARHLYPKLYKYIFEHGISQGVLYTVL